MEFNIDNEKIFKKIFLLSRKTMERVLNRWTSSLNSSKLLNKSIQWKLHFYVSEIHDYSRRDLRIGV